MSHFCENAKTEMLKAPFRSRRSQLAFLSAIFHTIGSLIISSGNRTFAVKTTNLALKLVMDDILMQLYRSTSTYDSEENLVIIQGDFVQNLLLETRILSRDASGEISYDPGINPEILADPNAEMSYLRGMFLGAGSMSVIKGYHLEFAFTNNFLASDCVMLLSKHGIIAKTVAHKDKTVVYIKNVDTISDLLARLGAVKSVLTLADIVVERSANRVANSKFNCDIANIDRIVNSSTKYTTAIAKLKENGSYESLDDKLKIVAEFRIKNADISLDALSVLVGISKSGLRHRLDKILALAGEGDKKN